MIFRNSTFGTISAILILLCLFAIIVNPQCLCAEEYLSAGEVTTISAGAVSLLLLGKLAMNFDSSRNPIISGPILFDASLQRFLGGAHSYGKTNFLDGSRGSLMTAFMLGQVLLYTNIEYPRNDLTKDILQDQFLYTSGLLATSGITALAKGLFARPRPLLTFASEGTRAPDPTDYRYNHQSFFSGHISSAFFAATFLNQRIRSVMRNQMSAEDYHNWRWLSPAVLYGWSSFVGWTRMHAYKHYFSDVVVGALVGWLMGELFYALIPEHDFPRSSGNEKKMLFQFGIAF